MTAAVMMSTTMTIMVMVMAIVIMMLMVVTIALAIKTRRNIRKNRANEKRQKEHNRGDGKRDL